MNDRQWLCREHLREHNQRWNYFAGMSDQEIERFCLDAITGHRPTWPLGKRAAANRTEDKERTRSDLELPLRGRFCRFRRGRRSRAAAAARTRLTKGQLDALAVLNLEETRHLARHKGAV